MFFRQICVHYSAIIFSNPNATFSFSLSRARFTPKIGLPEVEFIYGFRSFGLGLAGDA